MLPHQQGSSFWKKEYLTALYFIAALLLLVPAFGYTVYAKAAAEDLTASYQAYRNDFERIKERADISENGFRIIQNQVFPIQMQSFGEVSFIPALHVTYHRLALFMADADGRIVYKTEQLETNNRSKGSLKQFTKDIAAVSFQDMNEDGRTDIVLITSCTAKAGTAEEKTYKVGEVLFQHERGFYRDYRLSDQMNRFSMNKSIEFITAFVRDGHSTEFLYTAVTLDELLSHGFEIIEEQCRWSRFEKLGKLRTVPGVYRISDYQIFMIYLVNEQGYIVWSFQPMGDYENLYSLKGIHRRDIDGDGMQDVIVLARYSYEGEQKELVVTTDYSIYYQRTGGFSEDTEFKGVYQGNDEDTLEELIQKARAHWGWSTGT